jgi:hypothetical protein
LYGPFNLRPLRRWIEALLVAYGAPAAMRLSQIGHPLYLAALDQDATFTLFGPPDEGLQFVYPWVRLGPPADAPVADAAVAALSTMLSTEPGAVNGAWYRDCHRRSPAPAPSLTDRASSPAHPAAAHTPPGNGSPTGSLLLHRTPTRQISRSSAYYLDLLERHRTLQGECEALRRSLDGHSPNAAKAPTVGDVDLPYVGSTEAFTNMRESVAEKDALSSRFRGLLEGQLDGFPFDQPANVIYGAGGFSGILAGLVTTRQVEAGFRAGGGAVRQVYGVSAGVLNVLPRGQLAAGAIRSLHSRRVPPGYSSVSSSRSPSRRPEHNPSELWRLGEPQALEEYIPAGCGIQDPSIQPRSRSRYRLLSPWRARGTVHDFLE